ncbi:metalloregulator ArsR/SmtB family transcription factor [Clostridium oceanicum]|uniref:Metalloregulator ArsR/SmtB family transcription factor n=1 Tax=Clostridium oceanicum TaxID=1543 RepID=A0ABP3UL76_9CLOT
MKNKSNDNIEVCHCNCIHNDIVDKVSKNMFSEEELSEVAKLLKVFGDTTRVKILNALSIEKMCVCDLAKLLDMTQSAISHQLRVLKLHRLVKYKKDGKVVYYSLDDSHINMILNVALQHVKE